MKVTKAELKQIIKEEIGGVLNEYDPFVTIPSTRELGLPHDIGAPEKLLQGVEALLQNPGQIKADHVKPIVTLINKKLMKSADEAVSAALNKAKDQLIGLGLDPGLERSHARRQGTKKHHKAQADIAGAHTPPSGGDFYSRGGQTMEGKTKITKSQLKQIIKEEIS